MDASLDQELSDEEFVLMVRLLRRYTATEMDQFEHWKFDGRFSTIYVDVSMYPSQNGNEDAYTDLGHLLR